LTAPLQTLSLGVITFSLSLLSLLLLLDLADRLPLESLELVVVPCFSLALSAGLWSISVPPGGQLLIRILRVLVLVDLITLHTAPVWVSLEILVLIILRVSHLLHLLLLVSVSIWRTRASSLFVIVRIVGAGVILVSLLKALRITLLIALVGNRLCVIAKLVLLPALIAQLLITLLLRLQLVEELFFLLRHILIIENLLEIKLVSWHIVITEIV